MDQITDGDHTEPQAVIVSPTRELTVQIFNEARKFAHGSILKVCVTYGGAAVRHQADKIRVSLFLSFCCLMGHQLQTFSVYLFFAGWMSCPCGHSWTVNGLC